ncbi:MAG: hypothetical protein V4732_17810 [Pseudomonadota bacterium]
MLKKFITAFSVFSIICISGCSSLATMKKSKYVEKPADKMGLINIVRPSIFLGDGVKMEAWDGSTFIGTLSSGSMLQYAANPGSHCIMVNPTQGGKWATLKVEVKANTTYFIKPNTIPFVGLKLGLADETDQRKAEWIKELTPFAIDTAKTKPVPEKVISKAKEYSANCN